MGTAAHERLAEHFKAGGGETTNAQTEGAGGPGHAGPLPFITGAMRYVTKTAGPISAGSAGGSEQQRFPFAGPRSLRHIAADLVNHGRQLGHIEEARALRREQMTMLVRILDGAHRCFPPGEIKPDPEHYRSALMDVRGALKSWHSSLETTPLPTPPDELDAEKLAAELAALIEAKDFPFVPLRDRLARGLVVLATKLSPRGIIVQRPRKEPPA